MTARADHSPPGLGRVGALVAMVLAVSVVAISAVALLQSREHEAREKESVALVYAASLRQAIDDLVPAGTAPKQQPPPVLGGLIRAAVRRSLQQLETIRPLDPRRAAEIQALVSGLRTATTTSSAEVRAAKLRDVERAATLAAEIATEQHGRATRAELRGLIGSGVALGFAVFAVFMLVFRERRRSLAEAVAHTATVRRLAERDSLTDLPNRRRFDADLDGLSGGHGPVEIAVIDLNGFKQINDRLGHEAGDAVLMRVSRELETAVGAAGTVYRTGGDEFSVISRPGRRVADLARGALERDAATPVGSVGAASMPTDHALAREVVRLADRRMYAAKRALALGPHVAPPSPGDLPRRRVGDLPD